MEYFRYEHDGKKLTLYPLVCMHIGAKQADETFIKEHVNRIADDPDARYVYLGDGGECVTKVSKGELYEQQLSPDEQLDRVVELLEPIRGKGLFGVSGNHDRRISKLSGLDWTKALCARLGIPYVGISCFSKISVVRGGDDKHVMPFDIFWHHGTDSSVILQGKIRSAKKLDQLVWADAIFSAHSHICADLPPEYTAYLERTVGIGYKERRSFVCGCAYDSRVPGYAEERAYPPILPAYLGVTLSESRSRAGGPTIRSRIMDCQIWRKRV